MNFRDQILELINNTDAIRFHAYIPLERHMSKKNGRIIAMRGRRPVLTKSYDLTRHENILTTEFLKQRTPNFQTLSGPVWAIFLFYFARNKFFTAKRVPSRTVPDLSNLYELPQDCLQKAGIIENDNMIWSHDLSRKLPGDETGLEVILLDIEPDYLEFVQSYATPSGQR